MKTPNNDDRIKKRIKTNEQAQNQVEAKQKIRAEQNATEHTGNCI